MTIKDCPECGGTHFGSFTCPMVPIVATTAPALPMQTNRDKALRGQVVEISPGRLREMQQQAIRWEGIGEGQFHWHWAAAINELIALRARKP